MAVPSLTCSQIIIVLTNTHEAFDERGPTQFDDRRLAKRILSGRRVHALAESADSAADSWESEGHHVRIVLDEPTYMCSTTAISNEPQASSFKTGACQNAVQPSPNNVEETNNECWDTGFGVISFFSAGRHLSVRFVRGASEMWFCFWRTVWNKQSGTRLWLANG